MFTGLRYFGIVPWTTAYKIAEQVRADEEVVIGHDVPPMTALHPLAEALSYSFRTDGRVRFVCLNSGGPIRHSCLGRATISSVFIPQPGVEE